MDDATFSRVEEQRLALEDTIAKLRQSLRHWQTLEIDYEGLREEFSSLSDDATTEECLRAAKDFKPELVDDLESLVSGKSPSQLIDRLSKRTDYVTRNVESVRKQLSTAQKKWNALVLVEDPDHRDEAALPLREILEELDDDDNVVSSKVQAPAERTPNLIDVLHAAGVDVPEKHSKDISPSDNADKLQDDTVAEQNTDTPDLLDVDQSRKITAQHKSTLDQVYDNDDELTSSAGSPDLQPRNPDDTEEEAQLRQEMLQYGLGEVGAIVAELELEDMSFDEESASDLDSEDERGATRRLVLSDQYRQQMEDLEKKLGLKDLQNVGPRPPAAEAARKAAIARDEENLKRTSSGNHKKVKFAEILDIAPDNRETYRESKKDPEVNAIEEDVIERPSFSVATAAAVEPPRKLSKFKAERSSSHTAPAPNTEALEYAIRTKPTADPAGSTTSTAESTIRQKTVPSAAEPAVSSQKIISDDLIERPSIAKPKPPEDFDEELHKKEIAVEYQKLRNRRIHEQGGYVGGGEQDNYGDEYSPGTIEDNITGKPRKISRFRAARIDRS